MTAFSNTIDPTQIDLCDTINRMFSFGVKMKSSDSNKMSKLNTENIEILLLTSIIRKLQTVSWQLLYLDSLEEPLHESLLSCLTAQARSELSHILYNG